MATCIRCGEALYSRGLCKKHYREYNASPEFYHIRKRMSMRQRNEAVEMFKVGYYVRQIALYFGVSTTLIEKILHRRGIKRKDYPRGKDNRNQPTGPGRSLPNGTGVGLQRP